MSQFPSGAGLQNILSQSSAENGLTGEVIGPHHPITCNSYSLALEEDGTMSCDHSRAPGTNLRNQTIIDHSVAILLLELAVEQFR